MSRTKPSGVDFFTIVLTTTVDAYTVVDMEAMTMVTTQADLANGTRRTVTLYTTASGAASMYVDLEPGDPDYGPTVVGQRLYGRIKFLAAPYEVDRLVALLAKVAA